MELIILMILSGLISVIFYLSTDYVVQRLVYNHIEKTQIVKENNYRYAEKLKNYVKENNLSTSDIEKLDSWVKSEKIIMIQVFKDKQLVYDSEYDIEKLPEEVDLYDWEDFYDIEFSDGIAIVCISGIYFYKIYTIALITEIILSFSLFIFICILGAHVKIRYILKLSEEI